MSTLVPSVKIGNIRTVLNCTITEETGQDPVVRSPVDLSNSTLVEMEFEKPDGSRLDKVTATIKTPPGADGVIEYTDTVGIFDVTSRWKVRGVVTFSDGGFFSGTWTGFIVSD